jgi:monoamine oxidase
MSNRVYPPNSSGIKVIVVGLGYAGVAAAVECYRKGHQVVAFEQTAKLSEGGMSSM